MIPFELAAALRNLKAAHAFAELCRADRTLADATGASRDARQWIDEAVAAVVKAAP